MLHTIGESHAWRMYEQLIPLEQIHYYEGVTLKRVGRDENADLHNWVAAINLQSTDALIFVFGEIDIRVWARVHETQRGRDPTLFLVEWANAYLAKIKTSPANGARLFVQAIIPPGTEAAIHAKGKTWPVVGSDADRAWYTALANTALEASCREAGLGYLDVYKRHLGPDGMINPTYTDDGVHLNTPTLLRELLIEQGLL